MNVVDVLYGAGKGGGEGYGGGAAGGGGGGGVFVWVENPRLLGPKRRWGPR